MREPLPLPHLPFTGDEAMLTRAFLDLQRTELERRAAGLDAAGLRHRQPPSTLSLAGLTAHLAFVEDYWSVVVLAGQDPVDPWRDLDWATDPDHDFALGDRLGFDEVHELWRTAVDRARGITDGLDLDALARGRRHGQQVSVRWVLLHLIEEYARHLGHADLLREAVDGETD